MHRSFWTEKRFHKAAITQTSLYTQELLHPADPLQREAFKLKSLHRAAFRQSPQSSFYTEAFTDSSFDKLQLFAYRRLSMQKLLRTEQLLLTGQRLHTQTFTQTSLYTEQFLQTEALQTNAFTHRRFYTEHLLHTRRLL